jgi:hypothetical protein
MTPSTLFIAIKIRVKVLSRYGSLQKNWLCAMGNCSSTVKIWDNFHAMGHRARFCYALWAIASNQLL